MRIEKLKLHNFRQFIDTQEIEFATEEEKNITVLIGDNTTGKTTLIRAFEWILYDKNEFDKKILLNQNVIDNMLVGEEQEVAGTICLNHNGKEYEIQRRQNYTCIGKGEVRERRSKAAIYYQQPDGQTKSEIRVDFASQIERILPKNLSGYFFFGGERLGAIGSRDDIESAVKGLMGLDVLYNAMAHLKSVTNKLRKSLDFSGDEEADKLQKEQAEKEELLKQRQEELKTVDNELRYYRNEKEKYAALLKANETVREDQKRRERLEAALTGLEARMQKAQSEYVSAFSRDAFTFFGIPLLKEAVHMLEEAGDDVESVPDMTAETINYLLKRGYCICKKPIEKGSPLERELLKERSKQPPEAIGSLVRRFQEQALDYLASGERYEETVFSRYEDIRVVREEIAAGRDEMEELNKRLEGQKDSEHLETEYRNADKKIAEFEEKKGRLLEEIGVYKNEIEDAAGRLDNYAQNSKKNARIRLQIDYACEVYEWVQKAYYEREKVIREDLEKKVNENFQKTYHGSRTIMIDEKYRVKYYDVTTEESDGLKAVKSLAFVSGLVELAKEALTLNSMVDVGPLYYPLVMDAPFSNIDTEHIRRVSELLPEAAEQVIIALMEKDWNSASSVMSSRVGRVYLLEKARDRDGKFVETITHIRSQEVS